MTNKKINTYYDCFYYLCQVGDFEAHGGGIDRFHEKTYDFKGRLVSDRTYFRKSKYIAGDSKKAFPTQHYTGGKMGWEEGKGVLTKYFFEGDFFPTRKCWNCGKYKLEK